MAYTAVNRNTRPTGARAAGLMIVPPRVAVRPGVDIANIGTRGVPTAPHTGAANAPPPTLSDVLAEKRTKLASERTLMAWIRTSISLISFGFGLYKALQYTAEEGHVYTAGPRNLGFTLVSFGIIALVFASIQHLLALREYRIVLGGPAWSLALTMGGLLIILGLLVILNMAVKIGPF